MNKFAISLLAGALLLACTKEEADNGGTYTPSTKEHSSTFNINYTTEQLRSTKRGVCSNRIRVPEFEIPAYAKGVSWYYNWGNGTPETSLDLLKEYGIYFYPMTWNASYNSTSIKAYKEAVPDAPYLLAFNEPNLTDQANMTPKQAAQNWGAVKALAQEAGYKLISPALNYGTLAGYSDPITWMDEFLAQPEVSLDDFYGIALHSYMPTAAAVCSFIHRFEKYGKPIFLTEFCHANGNITNNADTQSTFMADIVNYLEADPMVEGYSWFMDRNSGSWAGISLLTGTSANDVKLTDIGVQYINTSSFDNDTWYDIRRPIPAEHFSNSSISESDFSKGQIAQAPRARKSTDSSGILELYDFYAPDSWVEYNVNIPAAGNYAIAFRYKADRDSKFTVTVGNTVLGNILLPATDQWTTYWFENRSLNAGKQKMRLTLAESGRAYFNWFYID